MKSYVITVLDDVCAKNNKDPEATHLLEVARSYGKVEELDAVIEGERRKYQEVSDNLTAQLDAIKAHNLTNDELLLVNAYRNCKSNISGKYTARIGELEGELEKIKAEEQERFARIVAIINKN